MDMRKNGKILRSFFVTTLLLSGSGIALADKLPEESFKLARMAIEEAQEVDADASAGSELIMAESKLQKAVENDDRGRDEIAERLLEQSMLHAELAEVEGMMFHSTN